MAAFAMQSTLLPSTSFGSRVSSKRAARVQVPPASNARDVVAAAHLKCMVPHNISFSLKHPLLRRLEDRFLLCWQRSTSPDVFGLKYRGKPDARWETLYHGAII